MGGLAKSPAVVCVLFKIPMVTRAYLVVPSPTKEAKTLTPSAQSHLSILKVGKIKLVAIYAPNIVLLSHTSTDFLTITHVSTV